MNMKPKLEKDYKEIVIERMWSKTQNNADYALRQNLNILLKMSNLKTRNISYKKIINEAKIVSKKQIFASYKLL